MGLLDNILGGLLGGGGSAGGGSSGGSGASINLDLNDLLGLGGNSSGSGFLDGRVDVRLLSEQAILDLGLGSSTSVTVGALDPDGDGLVPLGSLGDGLNLGLLDENGDGLLNLSAVGNLLDGVTGTGSRNGLLGGVLNGSGTADGLLDINLLNEEAVLGLGGLNVIDADRDGLVNLAVLDSDGDGQIDLGILDDALGLLDEDGNGLLGVNLLDLIGLDLDGSDTDGDLDDDGAPDSTNPEDFDVVQKGTAGRDSFIINLSQATYIDGGGDIDTASYAASASGFEYAPGSNGAFLYNGTKLDYLLNVERVVFSDGTLALDTGVGENTGMAYRIYQAAFDRSPDAAGLNYWIDRVDAGKSMVEVAADFLWSTEFQQTYGSLTNEDFVETLYENILQRAGEGAGIDYWTDQLDTGSRGRAEVLLGFSESQENVELVGSVIADGVFIA